MDQNTENPNPTPENQPPQPEPATPAADSSALKQESKTMAMLCHLLGLFTSFVGPLILWLIKKDEDKFVNSQGKEALNFQITIAIAFVVASILTPVFCIGILVGIAASICDLIFCILACVAANKGEDYRYPFSIRLVK